uniref:Uncharacterized protein n=1 Tax=Coccolithus braarudii TaxID=221442 RepID=A0A7S0Q842_9EUKA|mmetsp:Transcript_51888/g.110900  ORF Transcript_51888/g.110900 Transcript_51888/m.110900 type:complete len:291 (+) Transcript_51888:94-966(+)
MASEEPYTPLPALERTRAAKHNAPTAPVSAALERARAAKRTSSAESDSTDTAERKTQHGQEEENADMQAEQKQRSTVKRKRLSAASKGPASGALSPVAEEATPRPVTVQQHSTAERPVPSRASDGSPTSATSAAAAAHRAICSDSDGGSDARHPQASSRESAPSSGAISRSGRPPLALCSGGKTPPSQEALEQRRARLAEAHEAAENVSRAADDAVLKSRAEKAEQAYLPFVSCQLTLRRNNVQWTAAPPINNVAVGGTSAMGSSASAFHSSKTRDAESSGGRVAKIAHL